MLQPSTKTLISVTRDFLGMTKMVSSEEVEAGLLDQYSFASQQHLLDEKVQNK